MASTWGEPEITNASPMQGPAQISEVADFAMLRGVRHFATYSALTAATGAVDGYLAVVENRPGAIFRFNATTNQWRQFGRVELQAVADLATYSATTGELVWIVEDSTEYRWCGTAWAKWNMAQKTFAPVMPASTIGSAVVTGAYRVESGVVKGQFKFVSGTGAALGSSARFNLPESKHSTCGTNYPLGTIIWRDESAGDTWEATLLVYPGENAATITRPSQSGTYAAANMGLIANLGGLVPGAWSATTTGDTLQATFEFPIANAF